MAREGTRSQTGHATPRIFHPIDTAPPTTRKVKSKPKAKPKPRTATAAKPTGVVKKKAPKKEMAPAAKTKTAVQTADEELAAKPKATKETKPKATGKKR